MFIKSKDGLPDLGTAPHTRIRPSEGCMEVVNLADIKDILMCRVVTDEERALEYGCLMEAGTPFPPPMVYKLKDGSGYGIVDGRHRCLGAALVGYTSMMCHVIPIRPIGELLVLAFKLNHATGMPVNFKDARHTIMRMIDEGYSKQFIVSGMPYVPSRNNQLYQQAKSALTQKRCVAATDWWLEDPDTRSIDGAAAKFKVTRVAIEHEISFRRGKKDPDVIFDLIKTTEKFKDRAKTLKASMGQLMRGIVDSYQDGAVSRKDYQRVLEVMSKQVKQINVNFNTWMAKFDNIDSKIIKRAIEDEDEDK